MGDKGVAEQVMATEKPRAQKALGRKVKNFDEDLWHDNCYDIVKKGSFHKVSTYVAICIYDDQIRSQCLNP